MPLEAPRSRIPVEDYHLLHRSENLLSGFFYNSVLRAMHMKYFVVTSTLLLDKGPPRLVREITESEVMDLR